ncbi:MAG: hypothetical protein KGO82_07300, partial [Bacteroidota bacterium]|nr:hypothetical protein [Bacteroidota bacterium]
MMKSYRIARLAVIAALMLAVSTSAFAIDEWYKALPLLGSQGQIKKDSALTIQDPVFFDPTLKPNQTTYSIRNYLNFKFDEASGVLLPDSFTVTVYVKLYLTVLTSNGGTFMDSSTFTNYPLTLRYFKGGRSWNMADMNFQSAVRVKAVVQSVVTSAGATYTAIAGALMLESEMKVSREYNFNCTTNVISTVSTDASMMSSKGELRVSWPKDRMANEYDLEWAYIDSSALSYYTTSGNIDPKKIFVNNATRVSISKEEYYIPLLYDNPGVLFFRVRPVQIKYSGQRVEATWSSEVASSGLGQYSYASGHEPYLNWQATTSFAEEGKRKSVVQYYDGSLRSRQTVTKDNTTDTTIVAETMYDYQGRPVIQVMPSPSLSAMIKYTPNFNTDINNAEYDKAKYDDVLSGANGCGTGAAAMSSQAGASNYYSPNNPNKNNRYNKYIPDAKSYPFAETQYMADNTGRISKQGGVGFDMQIGRTDTVYNDSHETRYFYGSADQEDLNALFGTDAGNASHYFKNMVRDANGQYSVSYVDMHGRTIATALAGKPTAYLDSVKSSRVMNITKKLLDSVNNIKKGTLIESSKSLVVTKTGLHNFNYSLSADSLKLNGCTAPVCYDCLYNLTITITDDCNNQSLPGNVPYVVSDSNFTIGHVDTLCNAPVGFSKAFSLTLKEGTYLITKRLSVSKYGMDYYRDIVFMVKNTCKTLDDFIAQQRSLVYSQLSCAPTCQRCSIDTFRTWSLFRPYYLNQIGIPVTDTASYTAIALAAYNRQLKECDELCGNTTVAAGIRRQMLADITPPYGQYANPNAIDDNSIFYPSTLIPGRPRFADIQTYFDQNGKPDQITTATGTDIPQNASVSDFTDNFKDSWADSLITKHPEYCKLKTYESSPAFSGSNLFDQQFAAITTYKQAKAAGYLNPLGYADVSAQPSTVVKDPFFDGSINPTYAATWRSVLNDSMRLRVKYSGSTYLDIWSLATAMAQCDSGSNSCYAHYSGNQFPFDIDTSCAGSLDMAWRFFREMYLTKKREIINKILGQACNAQININTATHTLNFPDQVTAMQKVPVSTTNITDSINNLVSSSCRSYVAQWWNELAPCNYTSADTAYLFPRLIKICTEGGDMNHPFGSSTTKPSSTYRYHSFAELIQAYNDSLHAAGDPRNLTPGQCNAYLLSAPAPYDNRPVSSNQELWTKPDSCQCTTINTLYLQYQNAGGVDASFSAYLLRVAGTTISNSTLDSLRGLCNGTLTCRYLASPIIVPPVLQCGVKDVCADCSMVGNAYTKFQTAFPGITPAYASTDSIQRANNILFERFMNASLGFSKQAVDYLTFMDSCGGVSTASKCDTLSNILNGYRNRYLNYGSPDSSHFTVYGSNSNVTIFSDRYGEIFSGGYAHVGHNILNGTPYETQSIAIKKYDTLCVNNAFTIEARLKGDSSDMQGGRYCRALNFVFWDANGNAFSPTFEGIGAPSFATCGAGTWNVTGGNNVSTWDTTNLAMYYRNQLDWYRIKMVVKNYQVKVYANDTLLTTIPYSMPISKITKWAFGIGCGYVDYVKVWDSTGVLQYSEEFEDCRQSASNYPAALTCVSDCQASFTTYFNQQKGTNYSYTQIDSLYNTCNVKLTPCSDTLASKLSYLKNEFINNYYNHGRKYDANGCDTMTWKVDYGPLVNQTGVPHNRIFHDGLMQFPDTLSKAPIPYHVDYDLYSRDSACVENHFSIEFKMKDSIIAAASFQKLIASIALDTRPGLTKKYYIVFNAKSPGSSYIAYYDYAGPNASYSREIFNVTEFSQIFGGWKVVKFELIDSLFKFYVDGNLLRTFTFPVNVMPQKMYGIGFSSQGDNKISAAFDWIKMYDKNGQLFYNEDFNDCSNNTLFDPYIECPKPNCSNAFTTYYNTQQGTGYSYSQIDSIYRRYGLVTGVCQSNTLTLCGRSAPVFPPVTLKPYSPCDDSTNFIMAAATIRYQAWADSVKGAFNDAYLAKCLNAYKNESFTVTQPMSEFHYTLYYYDQAGNLLRTVPPEGVDVSAFRSSFIDSVNLYRSLGQILQPQHGLKTDYRYNTLNQVVVQSTPDAGQSKFWYDRLGRLVFSQNLKQKNASTTENNRQYSYTTYDYLGRINEVGQLNNTTANGVMGDNISRNDSLRNVWLLALTNRKEQVTRTYYDLAYPYTNTIPLTARNLRNRVAYTTITNDYSTTNFNAATFYSYDIHGNVDTLLQDYGASTSELTKNIMNRNGNRWARMVYQYDLISGKVNHVAFNP